MPIIGHAFVGTITARAFRPGSAATGRTVGVSGHPLWFPIVVGLAYLPDVLSELGEWAAVPSAKLASHSLLTGAPIGVLVGIVWARIGHGPRKWLCALAAGSIVLHDALDILQADDRAPFWPILTTVVAPGWLSFSNRLGGELLLFGGAWAIFEGWRHLVSQSSHGVARKRLTRETLIALAVVLVSTATAVTIEALRDARARQLDLARQLVRDGRFEAALRAADDADHWPVVAGPGRPDLVRGEAYEGLGNESQAEAHYMRAYQSDRDNFWALAALAEYYASHGTPTERHRRSAVLLEELENRFAGHPELRSVIERAERKAAQVH